MFSALPVDLVAIAEFHLDGLVVDPDALDQAFADLIPLPELPEEEGEGLKLHGIQIKNWSSPRKRARASMVQMRPGIVWVRL